ncbi:Serine/arginine-rich splicing factor 7 [Triplophysa tibetana]|uniref:Serine/arginine-rich splicing factor 7 n=1 Tax=Triplophysa tibetana TaxID=1572043 RepID=A0A5A9NE36_9TELE|nr:Serine/arginine-rich splicing factor 7 [Triplophysa tibetana]
MICRDTGDTEAVSLFVSETKVYVGNLGTGAGKGELERAFGYYGPLRTVWIARNPPGFAFVEFEDPRDAEDAVRGVDGKVICGSRVRVELSTGMPRRSRYDRPPTRRPFDPSDRCYECGEKGHYAYDCHRYSRRRRNSPDVYCMCNVDSRSVSTTHFSFSALCFLLLSGLQQVSLALSIQKPETRSLADSQSREKVQVFFSSSVSLWISQTLSICDAQTVQIKIPLSLWLRPQEQVSFSQEIQVRFCSEEVTHTHTRML